MSTLPSRQGQSPFTAEAELLDSRSISTEPFHLPGHPLHLLQNDSSTSAFLLKDLVATDLEKFAPKLWIMSKQDHANISPLHRQKVKGRTIILTEEPRLHLVWFHDRIFIKPLPKYLLCYAFWSECLLQDNVLLHRKQRVLALQSALGLLRTYRYLIEHESDFRVARHEELQLVPSDVSWSQFCMFSKLFPNIANDEVTPRYHYGEIRLTRLNFYVRFFLDRSSFMTMTPQYADYFARYYAPFLFAFAILSLALNSMQVALTAETELVASRYYLFNVVCWVFGILAILITMISVLILAIIWLAKFAREWKFALRERHRNRQNGP